MSGIELVKGASSARTPAAGRVYVFVDTDGTLKSIDEDGAINPLRGATGEPGVMRRVCLPQGQQVAATETAVAHIRLTPSAFIDKSRTRFRLNYRYYSSAVATGATFNLRFGSDWNSATSNQIIATSTYGNAATARNALPGVIEANAMFARQQAAVFMVQGWVQDFRAIASSTAPSMTSSAVNFNDSSEWGLWLCVASGGAGASFTIDGGDIEHVKEI